MQDVYYHQTSTCKHSKTKHPTFPLIHTAMLCSTIHTNVVNITCHELRSSHPGWGENLGFCASTTTILYCHWTQSSATDAPQISMTTQTLSRWMAVYLTTPPPFGDGDSKTQLPFKLGRSYHVWLSPQLSYHRLTCHIVPDIIQLSWEAVDGSYK